MAKQLEIDFTFLERRGLIRGAEFGPGKSFDGTGVRVDKMKGLLEKINEHLGKNATSWPSRELLAHEIGCSPKTITRTAQALCNLGVLIVLEKRNSKGHKKNYYRIAWSELTLLNPALRDQWMSEIRKAATKGLEQKPRDVTSKPRDVTSKPRDVTSKPRDVTSHEQLTNNTKNKSKNKPPLSRRERRRSSLGPAESVPAPWLVVVSVLKSIGVSACDHAVTAAQSRELTVEQVLELAERFKRLRTRDPRVTPAWLYRWITGQSVPPEDDLEQVTKPHRGSGLMSDTTRLENIRANAMKVGRRAGVHGDGLRNRVRDAFAQRGFDVQKLPPELLEV